MSRALLVAFEGIHGAGKSTQVRLLTESLVKRGIVVETTSSNGTAIGAVVTQLKTENRMPPLSMALAEAADIAYRWETSLQRALDGCSVVVADRYVTSALVRAVSRGIAREFAETLVTFAAPADLVFYVACPASTALERRVAAGARIDGHLSGSDYHAVSDHEVGFCEEQARLDALFRAVLPSEAVVLDGTKDAMELHASLLPVVLQALDEKRCDQE